jgi:hypothetical protein
MHLPEVHARSPPGWQAALCMFVRVYCVVTR